MYKVSVVLVVPRVILLEPLEMSCCIKRVFLSVGKHQAAFRPNCSFSHLNHKNIRGQCFMLNNQSLLVIKCLSNHKTHADLHLSDLEVVLVLCGQDHTGLLLATLCEETCEKHFTCIC